MRRLTRWLLSVPALVLMACSPATLPQGLPSTAPTAVAVSTAAPAANGKPPASAVVPEMAERGSLADALAPLLVDPPPSARAARAADGAYTVYEGVVCGVDPRPEHGFTVRYPKIWLARDEGSTTWLADNTDDRRLVAVVRTQPPPAAADLGQALARGWQHVGARDLRLSVVGQATIGGQPAARWEVRYTTADGQPMAGYTSAAVVNDRLYRVEALLPADRYHHLRQAADLVAAQLLLTRTSPADPA